MPRCTKTDPFAGDGRIGDVPIGIQQLGDIDKNALWRGLTG